MKLFGTIGWALHPKASRNLIIESVLHHIERDRARGAARTVFCAPYSEAVAANLVAKGFSAIVSRVDKGVPCVVITHKGEPK